MDEAVKFSGLSASTTGFPLRGGKYGVSANGTWGGGSAKLQVLLPDESTYLSVASGTDFTANGFAVVDLPPGQYRWTIATATAVAVTVARIP